MERERRPRSRTAAWPSNQEQRGRVAANRRFIWETRASGDPVGERAQCRVDHDHREHATGRRLGGAFAAVVMNGPGKKHGNAG